MRRLARGAFAFATVGPFGVIAQPVAFAHEVCRGRPLHLRDRPGVVVDDGLKSTALQQVRSVARLTTDRPDWAGG